LPKKEYLTIALHYDFLAEILPNIEERAVSDGYGFPCTGNPYDFKPDYECCTAEEISNWENDKIKFDNGQKEEMSHCWGIGISIYRSDHYIRLTKKVRSFLESWDYGDVIDSKEQS